MSKYKPKDAPVIPVLNTDAGQAGRDREEEMRKWEEEAASRRAAGPVTAAVEAAATVPAQQAVAASPAQAPDAEKAATRVAAAGYLPMPEFTEPDSSDPVTRLEFYSRGILAVQYAARANHERAEQQKLIGLGLRLKAMKAEELHKVAGFETFGDLTDARFGIKKHQSNNILRVLGVAQALEDITTQELKERPLRVLVPVLETHGADAVRATWEEAARHGNVTDTSLLQAANFLGFAPPKELPGPADTKTVERPVVASESVRVVERLRALAAKDRDRARREAEDLQRAVSVLVEELTASAE